VADDPRREARVEALKTVAEQLIENGDRAASALLPDPLPWTQGIYNEVIGTPIDWVRAEDLVDLIDEWLPASYGEAKCVDGLIRILRKLPAEVQITHGLRWVSDLCIQDGRVTVKQSWLSNDWLKEIRRTTEELGQLVFVILFTLRWCDGSCC
jgi:hypothetical protein